MQYLAQHPTETSSRQSDEAHGRKYISRNLKISMIFRKSLANSVLTTGGHFGYLKIAEGCDKHCTYCIIPKLRGKFRSVPMERLVNTGRGDGRARRKGADPGRTGNHRIWNGSFTAKKSLHILLKEFCQDQGNPLDPRALLLSGGDLRRTDPDHERRDRRSAIIWIFQSSMQVTEFFKRMGRRTSQAAAGGDHHQASPGNSGHCAPYHSDHRIPG